MFRWKLIFARLCQGALREGLFERADGICVESIMSRARAILVSLIPALLLLASLDCFSSPLLAAASNDAACLLAVDGHGPVYQVSADNSFHQAARRWSRRLQIQSGPDGFAAPATFAIWEVGLADPNAALASLAHTHLELIQAWQFHWRTAAEPRAPSLAS